MLWVLKPKRDDERNLSQLAHNFILQEHLKDLIPPLICPINEDLQAWRIVRKFAMSEGNRVYLTQAVDNAIKQLYVKVHNSVLNPTTQRDDVIVIYIIALLFNIGIRVWHNASVNSNDLDVQAKDYVQRCQQQNFGNKVRVPFHPIVNLLFIPAGSYWQGQLYTISKWGILIEHNSFYKLLSTPHKYSINCPNSDYNEQVSFLNNNVIPKSTLDSLDQYDNIVKANTDYHNTYKSIQMYFNLNNISQNERDEWAVRHNDTVRIATEAFTQLSNNYQRRQATWQKYQNQLTKYQANMEEYRALTRNQKRNPRYKKPNPPDHPQIDEPTALDYNNRQFLIIQELVQSLLLTYETPDGNRVIVDLTTAQATSTHSSDSEDTE
jgi:hypothetical protein